MAAGQPNIQRRNRADLKKVTSLGTRCPLTYPATLDGPPLMVSDNPETIGLAQPTEGVLCRQAIVAGTPSLSRVFLWHVNDTTSRRRLGITIENRGAAAIRVVRLAGDSGVVTDYLDLGQRLAKALLTGTLDVGVPVDTEIPPGQTGLVQEFDWQPGKLCGAQYEIRVESVDEAPLNYIVRTVYGDAGRNLREFRSEPLPLVTQPGTHVRGCWSGSEIRVEAQYEISASGAPLRAHMRLAAGDKQAADLQEVPDFLLRADNVSNMPPGSMAANRANFGAQYREIRPIFDNHSDYHQDLQLWLVPRGGTFAGTVRSSSMIPSVRGVPVLENPDPQAGAGPEGANNRCDAVRLGQVGCPPHSQVIETLALAASTPVALVIEPVVKVVQPADATVVRTAPDAQLPESGPGFHGYYPASKRWGLPETVQAIRTVAGVWNEWHPQGPRIGVGDISLKGGGNISGHASHEKGIDVDVRPVRNDGKEERVIYTDPAYSHTLTEELIDLFRANGILPVELVFFNDMTIAGTRWLKNHHNYFHLRFHFPWAVPVRPVLKKGARSLAARELQIRLNVWRRRLADATLPPPLVVDGDFGGKTETLLRAFQQARNLAVDGVAGRHTWGSLPPRPLLAAGDKGITVADLQQRLNNWITANPGTVPEVLVPDGDFGTRTDAAVRAFQAGNGLTVDGKVGRHTWERLPLPRS